MDIPVMIFKLMMMMMIKMTMTMTMMNQLHLIGLNFVKPPFGKI